MTRRRSKEFRIAFTATEVVVSVAIIAILAGLAVPSLANFKKRAEKAKCITNMKAVHSGLGGYLLDKNQWPQIPPESFEWEESDYFGWWVKAIEPYGVGPESWLCPSDKVVKERPAHVSEYASSYVPTPFNNHQFTPYRWNQPWLTERGDFHGKGAHVMMPDGSITSSQAPWGER